MKVITSERGRGIWERYRGTGDVGRWVANRTGQEVHERPTRMRESGATRGKLPPICREYSEAWEDIRGGGED